MLDESATISSVNHAWAMFCLDNAGAKARTGVGVNYLDVCDRARVHGCADAGQVGILLRSVLADDCVEAEREYPCPSPAARRWFTVRITRLHGPTAGAVVSHVNITRRVMAEQKLSHAASHDPLSGLANRALFKSRMQTALTARRGNRHTADVGVLNLDLDGFKAVNDTLGHAAGDEVLLTVAHRLRQSVRPGDTIARLGGDEFAVLAERIDAAGLAALAARIERSLNEPHRIHGSACAHRGQHRPPSRPRGGRRVAGPPHSRSSNVCRETATQPQPA